MAGWHEWLAVGDEDTRGGDRGVEKVEDAGDGHFCDYANVSRADRPLFVAADGSLRAFIPRMCHAMSSTTLHVYTLSQRQFTFYFPINLFFNI